ncbi:MAG: hypothetical protein KGO02_12535 [Alphaproteobacteria bacterium]|nr:hypothetical protein [Alphaproteobacteria bacterium]
MQHSKCDPKHDSNPNETAAPVVQAPTVTPAGNTEPAQAIAAPQIATQSDAQVIADPNHQDMKSDSQDAPVDVKADAAISDQDMDAPIRDRRQPTAGKSVHAAREPSALTGGLPELPVAKMGRKTDDKTPGPSGKADA